MAERGEPIEEAPKAKSLKEIIIESVGQVDGEMLRAKATGSMPGPNFRSKLEERAWYEWVPTMDHIQVWYEPFVLRMNSGNYTPDIVLLRPDMEIYVIEVKGSWSAYQSGRSSKKSLLEAQAMYGILFHFFLLMPVKGGGWEFTNVRDL
jgi:predicted nuclease of restriction endonuclease-like RecB superfamily